MRLELADACHDYSNSALGQRSAELFSVTAMQQSIHFISGLPRKTLLPPGLFQRFANDAFRRDANRIPEGLRVV